MHDAWAPDRKKKSLIEAVWRCQQSEEESHATSDEFAVEWFLHADVWKFLRHDHAF